MANRWEFDDSPGVHRFRDTRSGRFLSTEQAIGLRDSFQERQQSSMRDLARRLASEDVTVQQWEAAVRDVVRDTHAAEYVYGKGGINAMTSADWQAINALADEQAAFLRGFAQDVASGKLSEAQIAARANQYLTSSRQAYERGRASSWGMPTLSHYPADGQDACRSNCHCHLEITETGEEWRVSWRLGGSEHCADCRSRASSWSPLVISKASAGRAARLWRAVA
jgi:hypothetical protein